MFVFLIIHLISNQWEIISKIIALHPDTCTSTTPAPQNDK